MTWEGKWKVLDRITIQNRRQKLPRFWVWAVQVSDAGKSSLSVSRK